MDVYAVVTQGFEQVGNLIAGPAEGAGESGVTGFRYGRGLKREVVLAGQQGVQDVDDEAIALIVSKKEFDGSRGVAVQGLAMMDDG